MTGEDKKMSRSKRLGAYIQTDPGKLEAVLDRQQRLQKSGDKRLLGDLLVDGFKLLRCGCHACLPVAYLKKRWVLVETLYQLLETTQKKITGIKKRFTSF